MASVSLLQRLFPADPRAVGEEPDYRFTLANERTFLAWIRTALALVAGGLGAVSLLPDIGVSAIIPAGSDSVDVFLHTTDTTPGARRHEDGPGPHQQAGVAGAARSRVRQRHQP